MGVVIRKDGRGYNADRLLRERLRCGVHNLYNSVRDHGVRNGDLQKWRQLQGGVKHCDRTRSYSDEGFDGPDPRISSEKYDYLEKIFGGEQHE